MRKTLFQILEHDFLNSCGSNDCIIANKNIKGGSMQ